LRPWQNCCIDAIREESAVTAPHTHHLYDDPDLRYVRVEAPGDEPAPEPGLVEVAVLDMNHGWPNLGHSSIVETLLGLANEERQRIGTDAPAFRVVSYDVRGHGAVPSVERWRYPLVVGTGGPGAIDPYQNDGVAEYSQGIVDDPSWETPLHRVFEHVTKDESSALLAICHSFGLLTRWSGFATPVLRPRAKGGKSSGVVTNVLTEKAHEHPWFSGLWSAAGGSRIDVLDSRLYDLVPTGRNGVVTLAHEADGEYAGEAVTMVELARSKDGEYPRVWGVNSHPEIGDRGRQRERLGRLEARGEVTHEWVMERRAALEAWNASAATERRLQATADYTFEAPVRRIIAKAMAEKVGLD
jgi:hypothetical protein